MKLSHLLCYKKTLLCIIHPLHNHDRGHDVLTRLQLYSFLSKFWICQIERDNILLNIGMNVKLDVTG